jgi:hypothetical protein
MMNHNSRDWLGLINIFKSNYTGLYRNSANYGPNLEAFNCIEINLINSLELNFNECTVL